MKAILGLLASTIHRITWLGGNFVRTMTYWHRPINLFPAGQKTTWLSSLKLYEKNNAKNEKLNVFLQPMVIWEYFSTVKFVKVRHFQHENEKKWEKKSCSRVGTLAGKRFNIVTCSGVSLDTFAIDMRSEKFFLEENFASKPERDQLRIIVCTAARMWFSWQHTHDSSSDNSWVLVPKHLDLDVWLRTVVEINQPNS